MPTSVRERECVRVSVCVCVSESVCVSVCVYVCVSADHVCVPVYMFMSPCAYIKVI